MEFDSKLSRMYMDIEITLVILFNLEMYWTERTIFLINAAIGIALQVINV